LHSLVVSESWFKDPQERFGELIRGFFYRHVGVVSKEKEKAAADAFASS
jgi:hypothetical protein